MNQTIFLNLKLEIQDVLMQGQASGMDWTLHTDLLYFNNFQIIFLYIVGGGKEKRNLRIALINFLVMQFISNFDTSFNS